MNKIFMMSIFIYANNGNGTGKSFDKFTIIQPNADMCLSFLKQCDKYCELNKFSRNGIGNYGEEDFLLIDINLINKL